MKVDSYELISFRVECDICKDVHYIEASSEKDMEGILNKAGWHIQAFHDDFIYVCPKHKEFEVKI